MTTMCQGLKTDELVVGTSVTSEELTAPLRVTTILLVEDQDVCRITTKWFLANFGYNVVSARSAEEALVIFAPEIHNVVVTDNEMAGLSGAEMAHIIKLRSPYTPVIMYTGQPPADTSCLDVVFEKQTHLLKLKEAIDAAVATQSPVIDNH